MEESPASASPALQQYSKKQLERALDQVHKRQSARQLAKEEEKRYVEYRKAVVLASFQPAVGAMRCVDDQYPVRPRKGTMQFGERKAHYLSIRPNQKYATWTGRKKGVIEAKPRVAAPTNIVFTDHSAMPSPSPSNKEKMMRSNVTHKSESVDKQLNCTTGYKMLEESQHHTMYDTPDDAQGMEPEIRRGGKNADNPLVNGQPFWVIPNPGEQDELTDDDLPVDMDILEKVVTGQLVLAARPFHKTSFNPFGAMQRFKYDDALFVREVSLFNSTVDAVISLQPDDDVKYEVHAPIKSKIKWIDKINVTTFDPTNRDAGSEGPVVEDLKDIKREKGPKEK